MPTKTKPAIVVSEIEQVNQETKTRLEEDRSFWDDAVLTLLADQTDDAELSRVVEMADQLTALRRERYPLG